MTIGEAARRLCVNVRVLRWAIQAGRVSAAREPLCGWYDISEEEVARCCADRSWHHTRGWVSGRARRSVSSESGDTPGKDT